MWHSGSKCQRIKTLVNASRKWLKAFLAPGIRKLGPVFVAPKLGKFSLFDEFFPDLTDFWDLDIFWPFDFLDFLLCSTQSPQNLSTSPLPSFLPEASLLSSFLLEADMLPSFLLGAGLLIVFNIEVSEAAILLKPWMNRQ